MSMMFIKVIIKDYPIVLDYQVDHFGKKVHFLVKMASENQPGDIPRILTTN